MGSTYLVVSDLHLADVEDIPGGWKAYKSSRFVFDEDFDDLVESFVAQRDTGDRLTLILNGDIIDFDLVAKVPDSPPWRVRRSERKRGLDATEEKSVWKLTYVLSHHPRFLSTLARFVARGHRLVYIMGNHDREMHFADVQRAFLDALEEAARQEGLTLALGSVQFEPWFYYVPGEIYAEHGGQYDYYNSFRYLLAPVVQQRGRQAIALATGNLSNRYLMTRMGFFNPFSTDFILNLFDYFTHWLRHYAFSRRSLVIPWFWGSILVVANVLRIKRRLRRVPPEHVARMRRIARSFDLTLREIEALGQLQQPPIAQKLFRLLREFWLDRVLLVLVLVGGAVALAFMPVPLWAKVMVPLSAIPIIYSIYETIARGETIFTIEKDMPRHARAVAEVLPARVITFGHSHVPRYVPLSRESVFVDTGTWGPITAKLNGHLLPGLRNYLVVSFERKDMRLQFGSWMAASNRRIEQLPTTLPGIPATVPATTSGESQQS